MNAKFVKPPNAKIRFPPVIDLFARTLAASISATKFSLSVSAGISFNYNPAAKFLHIDPEIKGIKYIKIKESKIQLTASPEFLEIPASEDEELYFVTDGRRPSPDLEKKVKARAAFYARYRQYILNEIGVDCIATIRQYWINDILDLIPAEDVDYGENIYSGLEHDREWKDAVNYSREEISEKLVICSESTLSRVTSFKYKESIEQESKVENRLINHTESSTKKLISRF